MLEIIIPETELYDGSKDLFIKTKKTTLRLEHSLVSISKWESKWKKPFLTKEPKTYVQSIDYVRCMTLSQNIDPNVYFAINSDTLKRIEQYIDTDQTATWFSNNEERNRTSEQITSELIYYWMVLYGIPFECQKWHLSRLITLIRICNAKNAQQRKMPKEAILSKNRALNNARRKAMHTKG